MAQAGAAPDLAAWMAHTGAAPDAAQSCSRSLPCLPGMDWAGAAEEVTHP